MNQVKALRLDVRGLFNSFRYEKSHQYHRTFELPPKTTLIGFIGAALGYSEDKLYTHDSIRKPLFEDVKFGVVLQSIQGRIKDFWSIQKIKQNSIFRSPIIREQLFGPRYYIYITTNENQSLEEIYEALQSPIYPLSLGRDDELINIINPPGEWKIKLTPVKPPIKFSNTLLPFNISKMKTHLDLKPGVIMRPHLVEKLPNRFTIKSGVREPMDHSEFTFLTGYDVYIEEEIMAYTDGEHNIVFL